MAARFLTLETVEEYGDYWRILLCGIANGRRNSRLIYSRTGPFIPPLTVAGFIHLLAAPDFAPRLERVSGVKNIVPVHKRRIVRLDWSAWTLDANEPELRRFQEPEDIIDAASHDEELAQAMGDIYEVVLKRDGAVKGRYNADGDYEWSFTSIPRRGFQLFATRTPSGESQIVVAEEYYASLDESVIQWLRAKPIA